MNRILYVDGFNFYYGVTDYWKKRDRSLAGLGWCDFGALVRHFSAKGDIAIKYFTAPVTENVELTTHRAGEHKRYSHWIRALRTIDHLSVIRGFYKDGERENPDAPLKAREEKQTDVNLAIEMVADAFGPPERCPDQVFLLSGDCDLMPAIFMLKERAPVPVEVTVLLPSSGDRNVWVSSYNRTKSVLRECHGITTR